MNNSENLDLLLLHMPFGINYMPSLALGLLKVEVKNKGYSTIVKYFSLKFAKLIGKDLYNSISIGSPTYRFLLGEWIFSGTLFENLPPDEKYIKEILHGNQDQYLKTSQKAVESAKKFSALIPEVKNKTESFINTCLEEVIAINPKIIGFASSFQQNIASLALAKRIKARLPNITIVFGGANCEGEMGLEMIRKFPFIDIIVSGEADETFPELVDKIIKKQDYLDIPGVICRDNLAKYANGIINSPMITDMDSLPIPDYDDYYQEIINYGAQGFARPGLLFESSRGCWWGERSHCTFCGLNGNNMAHRSKSAARSLAEIKFLKQKYQVTGFAATDNILDMAYFKDFVPALAKENLNFGLFYEVKANLTKEQLKLLKAAKISHIQPGIESFSTHVLDIMRKGVKAIQNIQLLKWCKELGIDVRWNLISGFPGETKEDYYEMAEIIPKISHLSLTSGVSRLWLDRFSPNFNFPEKFGIKKLHPVPSYNYIFPFEPESIFKLAYFFDYEYDIDENFEPALEATKNELLKWKAFSKTSDLFFIDQEDALVVMDLRPIAHKPYIILYGKERFLYLLCDKIQPIAKIVKEFAKNYTHEPNESEINDILDSLIRRNLMIRENNSYLSLAVPLGDYSPKKTVMDELIKVLRARPAGDNQVTITEQNELLIQLNN